MQVPEAEGRGRARRAHHRLVRRQDDAERHSPVYRGDLEPRPVLSSGPRSSETNPPSLTLIVLGSLFGALPHRFRRAPTTGRRAAEAGLWARASRESSPFSANPTPRRCAITRGESGSAAARRTQSTPTHLRGAGAAGLVARTTVPYPPVPWSLRFTAHPYPFAQTGSSRRAGRSYRMQGDPPNDPGHQTSAFIACASSVHTIGPASASIPASIVDRIAL